MQKIQLLAILAVATLAVTATAFATLFMTNRITNTGNMKTVGVGVYWDSACTNNVTSINWGFLEPGQTIPVTVYIQNKGNVPLVLSMTTENWNPPSATSYITLNWDREDYTLDAASVVQATLTLSVSPNISGITDFNFDIVIAGTTQT